MIGEPEAFSVPLDGFAMYLRPSELRAVAGGLGHLEASEALVEAVRALPVSDRAPLWELAVRHYARSRPLEQAAGEIGMDALRARALLESFTSSIAHLRPDAKG